MKKILLLTFLAPFSLFSQETLTLDYYLPKNHTYNPAIPKPADIIGHEVGQWHITHDKLVAYMTKLAEVSPRITLEVRGKSYEDRPIILLTITAPENHQNLENIRQQHLQLTEEASNSLSLDNLPIVVYQGFSIHGNEPSGSNAALAVAYYLAAAEGAEIETLLKNTVILFDPSFNPDGLQRFSTWVNSHKSHTLNPDGNDREYREAWPGGRTNHYWFDLNRDWLVAQLPETQARVATFHKWMPNILTDHHEMGTNSTFFFQPGEPSRVHPLTPKMNQQLTAEIGKFHAKALDNIGSLYYSEEDFDDFYYGKGSTFPDINGSIGILFEQGSSRGHIQESENGILTFPFTIRNQFTAALSTLEAAKNMRTQILSYQRDFYRDARNTASKLGNKAYIFGDEKDAAKTHALAALMKRHRLNLFEPSEDMVINGKKYTKGHSFILPKSQKASRLIEAMFDLRTQFTDSLFYDISAWSLPHAFNVDYAETTLPSSAAKVENLVNKKGLVTGQNAYAYLFEWHEFYTPKALNKILQKGIRAKVAMLPFTLEGIKYDYGTIMVPAQNQDLKPDELFSFLKSVAAESHINITGVNTGLSTGIDLGSRNFMAVEKQKVALLVGNGINSNDAGEIWHLFDQHYAMHLTKLDTESIPRADLSSYTTIIVPDLWGGSLNEGAKKNLETWVKNGGTLIGFKGAAKWMKTSELINVELKTNELVAKNIPFEKKQDFQGAQVTGGAIFMAKTDRSHPINFGYKNNEVPLFRDDNVYIAPDKQSYNNPIQYTKNPLVSGYISEENLELLKGSVPFQVQNNGSGKVIAFTDNTCFRAFWYGTNKLLMNAVFFAKMM